MLVGTTSSFGSSGITLGSNSVIYAAASSQNVANFQRYTTDGEIVRFGKDGSTVGSIFSGHGGSQVGIGTNTTGITFNPATRSMMPANPSSTNPQLDATLDIGFSSVRWKDLYLSGGVYLGGTGSANKLDDYEEGTWSPVFSDAAGTGNAATANGGKRGFYTKIGNTVHVYCIGSNLVTTGMTGTNDLYIQGLPFTPTSFSSPNQSFVGTARLSEITYTGYVVSQVTDNTTYLRLNEVNNNAGVDSIIVNQLNSAAADVILSMTYQTNS